MNLRRVIFALTAIGFGLSLSAVQLAQAIRDSQTRPPPSAPGSTQTSERFLFTSWGTEDGLPQATVTSILQTSDGYIWLGTYGGLVRFDGVRFTLFHTGNTPELKSIRIRALYEDREGTLWIGTEGGGLTRMRFGTFQTFTTEHGLPRNDVGGISQDSRGNIWIESGGSLVRLEHGERFVTLSSGTELPFRALTAPAEDREGNLWFGTPAALVKMDSAGQTTTYTTAHGLPGDNIQSIFVARDGKVWIGTLKGLAQFNGGTFKSYTTIDGLSSNYITALSENRAGDLLIGTWDKGANRLSGTAFTPFTVEHGLSQNRVRSVAEDAEGNLWVGTDTGGLNRIKRAEVISYTRTDGLPADSVVPITEDAAGNVWIGATCGGLIKYRDGRFTSFPIEGSSSNCVWSLHADADGTLWIGTWNGGLTRFKDGTFTTFTDQNSSLSSKVVLAIHRDRNGYLWVGTANGLHRFTEKEVVVYRREDGLIHDDVRFITEARDGSLLLGTYGGFSHFKDGKFTSYNTANGLSHNFVRAIHEDADGALWIGTYGGGLNRFKDGHFTHYGTSNGLFDDIVSRILEDNRGNLWMSGNKGIFSARLQELNEFATGKRSAITSIAYDDKDGMAVSETNGGGQPAGWRTRDNKLWFPTIRGVVVIDPARAGTNILPPPVVVEKAFFDKRVLDHRERLKVPPGRGDLEIHYTALSFVEPEQVSFRYRLEGYDQDWVEAAGRRIAYYTNIPPGEYRFHVIAANDDGIWNEGGATFNFYLTPHFYQTAWFYALLTLALIFVGLGAYRMRVRQLVKRATRLENKVAERTSELERQRNQLEKANTRLAEVNTQVERFNDDMLSILNRLSAGVLMTNADGTATFLSTAAERLLGIKQDHAIGSSWKEALPLTRVDQERISKMMLLPSAQRGKIPAQVEAEDGRRYWMEIEVQDDPRESDKRIFFLSDVSEIYDLRRLRDEAKEFKDLVGQSAAMQLVFKQIRDVARVDATVLIEGETGTGKELVARAIHQASARRSGPFIPVNCAGLTESLLASQLFGHKRGAFTGATADHAGLFEAADGGTLFLDEIGDVPPSVQTNLLRVLQEREITRLGENVPRHIDVRIISATHRNLNEGVLEGVFREDLLYRIRVARIDLPPLRERPEDIPVLAAWFLEQSRAGGLNQWPQEISTEAIRVMSNYHWPGNVRELKSAIEFAVIRATAQ